MDPAFLTSFAARTRLARRRIDPVDIYGQRQVQLVRPTGTSGVALHYWTKVQALGSTGACLVDPAQGTHLMTTTPDKLQASDFRDPAILLSGTVDYDMYASFRDKLISAPEQGVVAIELTTLGGDPEVARIMGEDVRFRSELNPDRRFVFLGKAAVYSAGTTFMSFFAAENRYLTRGTRLMIHERKMDKQMRVEGPLSTCIASLEATLNEIRASIAIQNEGFENLVRGSQVSMEEVLRRAPSNWYVEAREALKLGLISGII